MIMWLLSALITTGLSLALFYLGFFGGADAKALISLSVALPVYPSSVSPILNVSTSIFPLAVLSNALLGSLFLVFAIGAYNISKLLQNRGKLFEGLEKEPLWKKVLAFVIGFKVETARLQHGSHHIPLQYSSKDADGKIVHHLRISFRLEDESPQTDDNSEDPLKDAPREVWVTPGLPFLVFVTAGFVATLVIGDMISWFATQLVTLRAA